MLSRRLRSWLTLLGIFTGIAAVVALISLGQGMQDAINDQFAGLGVNTLTVQNAGVSFGPPGTTNYGTLTDHDVSIISRIHDVDYVIPRYIQMAILTKGDIDIYGYVASMPGGEEDKILMKYSGIELEDGVMFEKDSTNKIVLGNSLANNDDYKFQVGDKLI
jgi:putative ABC transport system permease protein